MFDAHGTLKIVDFGIAHLTQTAAARLTAPNTVIGSPPYLSPEQLQARPADERSDVYALGCVITTMLTGRPPFEGEHPLAYAHQHVSATPPRIRDRRPDVSPALDALVAQLLSKSPQDRPQSAQAVLERLTHPKPDWPTSAAAVPTTVIPAQTTRPMPADVAATAPPMTRLGQRSTRGRWIAAGAVVLILVAAVLIAAVMAESQTAGSPSASTSPAPSRQPATTTSQAPPSSDASISPAPSRQPATTSATPSAEASSTTPNLRQAMSDLREAVRAVSSNGQIDTKKAKELAKRVDELDKHLTEKRGGDAVKKVDDLDKYLTEQSQMVSCRPKTRGKSPMPCRRSANWQPRAEACPAAPRHRKLTGQWGPYCALRLAASTCALQCPSKSVYVHGGLVGWLPSWLPEPLVLGAENDRPSLPKDVRSFN